MARNVFLLEHSRVFHATFETQAPFTFGMTVSFAYMGHHLFDKEIISS